MPKAHSKSKNQLQNMKKITLLGLLSMSLLTYAQNPGSLDITFGTGGKVVTSVNSGADKAFGVALQADGKILVAGVTTSATTGKDFVLLRYNENGSLDAEFGGNGIVSTDVQLGSDDEARSIVLQADGKIVVAGSSDDGNQKKGAVVRYNIDGSIDTTFGTNGVALLSFEGTQNSEIKVVKIHALTGNILVGGSTAVNATKAKPVVARLTSAGVLDTSFNETGIRLLWISSLDSQYLMTVEDLVVQTNGKISCVGWRDFPSMSFSNDMWACRINTNGTMDTAFSTDGVNTYNGGFNGNDRAFSLHLKDDASMVVAGSGDNSSQSYAFVLFEVATNGVAGGTSTQLAVNFNGLHRSFPYKLAVDSNGRYVMAGSTGTTNERSFALARVSANYAIDNTFDNDGKVTTTFNNNLLNEAYDAVVQPNNRIVLVGYTGNDIAIARYFGEQTLSNPDFNANNHLSAYPNPVQSTLFIKTTTPALNESFIVVDFQGRVMINGFLSAETNEINVENLSSGIYFFKATSSD